MQYRKNCFAPSVFLIVAAWLGNAAALKCHAQAAAPSIVNPFPCIVANQLPEACLGQAYSIRFQFTGAAASNWTVVNNPGCADLGFVFANAAQPLMTATSAGGPTGLTGIQTFCVRAVIDGTTVNATFTININASCTYGVTAAPCMWDIAFVLDHSGSMNWPIGMSPTPTRWDDLVDIFSATGSNHIQTMAAAAGLGSDDRWGVFFFGNNGVIHDPMLHEGDFGSSMSTAWPLPAGNTPMGGGLQAALQDFFSPPAAGRGRAAFLLTDGAQNRNPRVEVTSVGPLYVFEIAEDLGWDAGTAILGAGHDLGLLPIPSERFSLNTIHLFSVGIGLGTATGTDLEHMSEEFVNAATTTDLVTFFNATIPDIFKGATPRMVNVFRDTIPAAILAERSFVVNRQVRNLTLQFVAQDGYKFSSSDLYIKLYRNGELIPVNPVARNERLVLYDLDFPQTSSISDPQGVWTIQYRDAKPVPCLVTIFADDKALKYALDFQGKTDFVAGDDLPVRLTLSFRDTAVLKAQVTAYLLRPGEDIGDFVSKIGQPNDTSGINHPDLSQGQYKINAALTSPAYFVDLTKEVQNELKLIDQGDGTYTGVFTGNNVSGGYRVITRITGTLPNGDPYEGWDLEGVFCDFARPSEIDLNEQLVAGNITPDGQSFTMVITPTNRLGLKIGPAQENRIYVQLSQGSVQSIQDNLDGSYSIRMLVAAGSNPVVTVALIDPAKPILQKCLRCFDRPWALSLHTGADFPFSALDSLYDAGAYVELDLRYRFNQNFALELVGGYYGFQSDFHILGATVFATYSAPNLFGAGWDGRVAAGPGYFKPSNESATWGYGLRAGVAKRWNTHWETGLEASMFSLPDRDYLFGAFGLGIHYNF